MDIDLSVGKEKISFSIANPYRFDLSAVMREIVAFSSKKEVDLAPFKIEQLIPRMIRGVAGCEGGCPSDAKSFIREGFGGVHLSYIEGGILKAVHPLGNGEDIEIKVFPQFE